MRHRADKPVIYSVCQVRPADDERSKNSLLNAQDIINVIYKRTINKE
ncbi:MAG: hypothetical protein KA291_08120 [Psychrobacter sp.]|uniref:Uncharacterized protein n=1 Tax=Psychrobacter glacincola TaxID=56810 RepID=A0ABW1W3T9_9GAMM|nr:hypothetical protein [Psychrobacter glacincola]MBP6496436.1 hypothetical protein [Psychrobacter sp.]